MHGAAHAPVKAIRPAKDLSQRAVQQVIDRQIFDPAGTVREFFHNVQRCTTHVGFHDCTQRLLVQFGNRR